MYIQILKVTNRLNALIVFDMEISYKIFNSTDYDIRCEERDMFYPSMPLPTVEEFTYKGTGKVVGYIDGGFFRKDKFLIVDKETKKFMKVKVSDCEVLEY